MKIEMKFSKFLGDVEHGYVTHQGILNLYNSIPIKKHTHPRLWKYNSELYEN